jgi:death-on-curing protein
MRDLPGREVVSLHAAVVSTSGGAAGLRDLGALESALAQPRATFDGVDLYPGVIDKASSLGFGLALNHPFIDGNKRIAHAAMAVFLELNGLEIQAPVDDQERLMLDLAAGTLTRDELTSWLAGHVVSL